MEARKVLTVDEVVLRINELNGKTVSVAGYLPKCGVYDCTLYRSKAEYEQLTRVRAYPIRSKGGSILGIPSLSVGAGRFYFDALAWLYWGRDVVITGAISNKCRIKGHFCLDRVGDLSPTTIRSGGSRSG